VDKRLCLPEVGWTDAYAARRARCNVPKDSTFESKPQWAAVMLHNIVREGLLPCTYVVADCLYGQSPDCLEAVEACVGGTACGAIPADTRCWLQRPQTEAKGYT
jgi:SRSO17 transposase